MPSIPSKTQILVIGGGPGGSYAASALAREGFQVTLLESAQFPRYHIGESMLPSMRFFCTFIDVLEKIKERGFCVKPGAAVKFNQHKREGYTDFIKLDVENGAWNVVRSELDEILLRHAAENGASVFELTKVTSILFENDDVTRRPIAATYESSLDADKVSGTIHFDYLVDASGRAGIMSQKYLKNRTFNKSLNNIAMWGYWTGCGMYSPDDPNRRNAPWFEALKDETGWAWFIPLHDGTVSVGIVKDQDRSNAQKKALKEETGDGSLEAHYLNQLKLVPHLLEIKGPNAKLVTTGKDGGAAVKQAADYSYAASAYAGPNFRLVGDASAFIDPFFSSGIHLALGGGLSAAATIASSLRGEIPEEDCWKFHSTKVGTAYTRFLVVVLAAYKQMRAQQVDVLSDVDEDNFDRAFDLIRPVIQGSADIGKKLSENEVQHTLDFVNGVMAQGIFGDEKSTSEGQAQKEMLSNFVDPKNDFSTEKINGFTVNVVRGSLGLTKA